MQAYWEFFHKLFCCGGGKRTAVTTTWVGSVLVSLLFLFLFLSIPFYSSLFRLGVGTFFRPLSWFTSRYQSKRTTTTYLPFCAIVLRFVQPMTSAKPMTSSKKTLTGSRRGKMLHRGEGWRKATVAAKWGKRPMEKRRNKERKRNNVKNSAKKTTVSSTLSIGLIPPQSNHVSRSWGSQVDDIFTGVSCRDMSTSS